MSRSGKSGIAPIVSSLERVEHFKIRANFDRFLMVYASGNLSKQGFKYLFENRFDIRCLVQYDGARCKH